MSFEGEYNVAGKLGSKIDRMKANIDPEKVGFGQAASSHAVAIN